MVGEVEQLVVWMVGQLVVWLVVGEVEELVQQLVVRWLPGGAGVLR